MMIKIIDFSKYLSIKIGAALPVKVIDSFTYDRELKILGFGFNLLIAPSAKNLAILGDNFDYIRDLGDYIEVGGSTSSAKIFRYFWQNNLTGLEFLRALPGSLGGLVKMNAGMKEYEMKGILDSVCVDGVWRDAKTLGIAYRKTEIDGVIFAARFKKILGFQEGLLEKFSNMRKTHPKFPSCGSCFKNPEGDFAGRLLEAVGMKGYFINGVGFSEQHANFLVNKNRGVADFASAMQVIELAEKKVSDIFGIKLQKEVIIIE
ncbi:UDP-N-acetylmuramate dehydrogenase [Helicobacter anatolicus]|uniref:UDP-N-acetylmuramate dehydrogenase n=1 Tax=Helicobacter anatolicus TaxID=2905874 RepID=UPI001E2A529E|nr:UDP-N-acetylmuramate dehydrogenase [Helicobacter anatolicus]